MKLWLTRLGGLFVLTESPPVICGDDLTESPGEPCAFLFHCEASLLAMLGKLPDPLSPVVVEVSIRAA